jgi:hypothetical protein
LRNLLGKLFLGLLGVCYATGLVVVNTRLNEYGIYSLNLVQSNYITAGILTWLPILIPSTIIFMGRALFPRPPKTPDTSGEDSAGAGRRRDRFFKWVGYYGDLLFFAGGMLLLALLSWMTASVLRLHFTALWLLPFAVGLGFSYGCLVLYAALPRLDVLAVRAGVSTIILFMFLLLTMHVVFFGRWLYPTVPFYLGGGEPQRVQIIVEVTEPTQVALASAGIEFEAMAPRAGLDGRGESGKSEGGRSGSRRMQRQAYNDASGT